MSKLLPPDEPTTLAEYLWYCREYEHDIYFRAQRNGKWCNVSLADLAPDEFGDRLARLIEEGRIPVRLRRD